MSSPISPDRIALANILFAAAHIYQRSGFYDKTNRVAELDTVGDILWGEQGEPDDGPLSAAQRDAVISNAGAIRYAIETVNGVLREMGVDESPGGHADDISDRTEFDSVGDMLRASGIGWPRLGDEAGEGD